LSSTLGFCTVLGADDAVAVFKADKNACLHSRHRQHIRPIDKLCSVSTAEVLRRKVKQGRNGARK